MNAADVLIAPVVSEKSYAGLADRQYTFKVHQDAHKTQVRQAVEQLFGVKVKSVRILKVPAKPKRRGLFNGVRPGWKKAVVQLHEGQTIEIFEGAQVQWLSWQQLRSASGARPAAHCVVLGRVHANQHGRSLRPSTASSRTPEPRNRHQENHSWP